MVTIREFWEREPHRAAVSLLAVPKVKSLGNKVLQRPELDAGMQLALNAHHHLILKQLGKIKEPRKDHVFCTEIAEDLVALSYVVDDGARVVSIYTEDEAYANMSVFEMQGREVVVCE